MNEIRTQAHGSVRSTLLLFATQRGTAVIQVRAQGHWTTGVCSEAQRPNSLCAPVSGKAMDEGAYPRLSPGTVHSPVACGPVED